MPPSDFHFADLHFHTHFSDNRDRATVRAMVEQGRRHGITVFGVGDHNHNLDSRRWRALVRESDEVQRQQPSLLLLRNCEITFLMGHFLVVEPRSIAGTIDEGYGLLYGSPSALRIINHPHPALDEWHRRIIPTACGIEVINGAVLRRLWDEGLRLRTAFDLPSLRVYGEYLRCGCAVAAMGASDAHALAEIGRGMTGLWVEGPLRRAGVVQAIRGLRTFATTDPGISLSCGLDTGRGKLSWQVEWNPRDRRAGEGFAVEVYRNDELRGRAAAQSGCVPAAEGGLYWVAAFSEREIAVSSPVGAAERGAAASRPHLFEASIADMVRLRMGRRTARAPRGRGRVAGDRPEIDLLTWGEQPFIVDADGTEVACEVLSQPRERIVIDKTCGDPCFDEFLLWLRRNEIHEHAFVEVRYRKEGDLLSFDGRIAPASMILERGRLATRRHLRPLRGLIDAKTSFRLSVRTLFASRVRLLASGHRLPFEVGAPCNGLRSLLLRTDAAPGQAALERFFGDRAAAAAFGKPVDRLYQVFVVDGRGPRTGR